MKKLSTLILAFVTTVTFAQNISKQISASAEAVIAVKAGNLTQLMSVSELDNNALVQMMVQSMTRNEGTSLNDLGIDLNKTAFYSYETSKDAVFHCVTVPLANASKFSALIGGQYATKLNGLDAIINKYDGSIMAWDSKKFFFVMPQLNRKESDNKYGYNSNNYGTVKEVEETPIAIYETDESEEVEETVIESTEDYEIVEVEEVEEVEEDVNDVPFRVIENTPEYPGCTGTKAERRKCFERSLRQHVARNFNTDLANKLGLPNGRVRIWTMFKVNKEGKISDIKVRAPHPKLEQEAKRILALVPQMKPGTQRGKPVNVPYTLPINFVVESSVKKGGQQNHFEFKTSFLQFDNEVALALAKKRVAQAFGKRFKTIKNNDFEKAINDQSAEAVVWVKDFSGLYGDYMKRMYRNMPGMSEIMNMQTMYGQGEMVMKLFLENDEMRIRSTMGVNGEMKQLYQKMMNAKVNPKLLNYINKDALGYMSYAINTQAMLEEYPKLIDQVVKSMSPEYTDISSLAGDMFALLLDEKAVADLINGDMVVVLNDMGMKEVEYTTYEYDEDYNRKKVTKTKEDMVPEFSFMFSTKNQPMFNRMLTVAQKRLGLEQQKGYYKMKANNDIPMDMFMTVNNGIVFFSSSENTIKTASKSSGKSTGLSSEAKQSILNNNLSMRVDFEKIMEKVPTKGMRDREMDLFNYIQTNIKDMYIESGMNKEGKVQSDMYLNIPKNHKNALAYFLNFAEKAAMSM